MEWLVEPSTDIYGYTKIYFGSCAEGSCYRLAGCPNETCLEYGICIQGLCYNLCALPALAGCCSWQDYGVCCMPVGGIV